MCLSELVYDDRCYEICHEMVYGLDGCVQLKSEFQDIGT